MQNVKTLTQKEKRIIQQKYPKIVQLIARYVSSGALGYTPCGTSLIRRRIHRELLTIGSDDSITTLQQIISNWLRTLVPYAQKTRQLLLSLQGNLSRPPVDLPVDPTYPSDPLLKHYPKIYYLMTEGVTVYVRTKNPMPQQYYHDIDCRSVYYNHLGINLRYKIYRALLNTIIMALGELEGGYEKLDQCIEDTEQNDIPLDGDVTYNQFYRCLKYVIYMTTEPRAQQMIRDFLHVTLLDAIQQKFKLENGHHLSQPTPGTQSVSNNDQCRRSASCDIKNHLMRKHTAQATPQVEQPLDLSTHNRDANTTTIPSKPYGILDRYTYQPTKYRKPQIKDQQPMPMYATKNSSAPQPTQNKRRKLCTQKCDADSIPSSHLNDVTHTHGTAKNSSQQPPGLQYIELSRGGL